MWLNVTLHELINMCGMEKTSESAKVMWRSRLITMLEANLREKSEELQWPKGRAFV
jgi:hypothetical protein